MREQSISKETDTEAMYNITSKDGVKNLLTPTTAVKGNDTLPIKRQVFTGNITNAVIHTNDSRGLMSQNEATGEIEYKTDALQGVQFIKNDLFDNTLSEPTKRLYLYGVSQLAQNVGQGEKDIHKIKKGMFKPFSLDDYMKACGLKDKREATRSIRTSIKELTETKVACNMSIWNEKTVRGKTHRFKDYYMQVMDILNPVFKLTDEGKKLNYTPQEYAQKCIEKGLVYLTFNLELASVLVLNPLLNIPEQIFKIDLKKNPHGLDLTYYLLNMYNQGHYNKVNLLNAMQACPHLPIKQLFPNHNEVIISLEDSTRAKAERDFNKLLVMVTDSKGEEKTVADKEKVKEFKELIKATLESINPQDIRSETIANLYSTIQTLNEAQLFYIAGLLDNLKTQISRLNGLEKDDKNRTEIKENIAGLKERIARAIRTGDTVRLYKHIVEPFNRALDELVEGKILKKNGYKLVDRDGKDRTFTELTKQNLADTFLIFELTDEAKPKPEAEIKAKQIKRSTKKA